MITGTLSETGDLKNACYNHSMTDRSSHDDQALVQGFLDGEEGAAEELVRRYQKKIYALAYRMVYDMENAKDITQRVFTNAIQGLRDFRKESSFKNWLYTIAMNLCLNERKKDRYSHDELDDSIASNEKGVLTSLIDREEKDRIRAGIQDLPERQRAALVLRVYEQLSCKETASVMGCTEGAVKAHYHHAVRKLREMIKGRTEDAP